MACNRGMGMGNSCMEMKITFKKYIGFCTAFIVFMIKLTNLEINYQRLSLSLSWTCYREIEFHSLLINIINYNIYLFI